MDPLDDPAARDQHALPKRPAPLREYVRLHDGREFLLRPLTTADLPALRRAFQRLTPEEVELRFMHQTRELPAFVEDNVRALDPARDVALALEYAGEIRAVADFHIARAASRAAEFGLIVGQAVAGHGLGTLLMQCLLDEAHHRGLDVLRGFVRFDNARMLELCRNLGASVHAHPDDPALLSVEFKP